MFSLFIRNEQPCSGFGVEVNLNQQPPFPRRILFWVRIFQASFALQTHRGTPCKAGDFLVGTRSIFSYALGLRKWKVQMSVQQR